MNNKNLKLIKLKAPKAEILIVDDNDINLDILEAIFLQYKMKVTTALSGSECLAIINGNKKVFDLIIMDQMMPEMNGIETLNKIRELPSTHYKTVPVIALTANDAAGMEEKFLEKGFQGYMSKPVDIGVLNKCLINHLSYNKLIIEEMSNTSQNSICKLHIEGVDTSLGLKYLNGNIDCYKDILKSVCKESKECKLRLTTYKEKKDWKGYSLLVHGLKGMIASIGANHLSVRAKEHEFAAKNENIAFINQDFEEFIKEYDTLVLNIQNVMTKEEVKEDKVQLNKKLSGEEIQKIIKMTDAYERDEALHKLHEIERYLLTRKQKKVIASTIELLEDFSYDEVCEVLSSLLDHKYA